jgi:hypothetical protein
MFDEAAVATPDTAAGADTGANDTSTTTATADTGAAGVDLDSPNLTDEQILNEPDEPEKPATAEGTQGNEGEQKPAEEKPEGAGDGKKPEDEKPEEQKPEADKQGQDDAGEAAVKQLIQKIDADPALKAALDANPALKNTLFAHARRSQELSEYKNHFKTSELAKAAREAAEEFGEIENTYLSGKPESYDDLLDRMFMAQVKRDPATGEPVKDENGNIVSTGKYEAFLQHYRQKYMWPGLMDAVGNHPVLKQRIEQLGSSAEDVLGAIELVAQVLGDPVRGGDAPTATAARAQQTNATDPEANLPESVKKELAEFRALKRQQGDQTQEQGQQYLTEVKTTIETDVKGYLGERVKNLAPALSDAIRRRIIDDAYARIGKIASEDKLYRDQWGKLYSSARGAEGKQKLSQYALRYARECAQPIVQELVNEFSKDVVDTSKQKIQKLDEQKTRVDVRSQGGATQPSRQDEDGMIHEAEQLAKELFGRSLKDNEILNVEETLEGFRRVKAARKK